ncbi:unnamed protein product [Phytomonas sp. EM1]|nr:unnamed protein product [Phytomonas sp. EM1]|eukprot:CCW63431.1 unnamed protein product [Phytomonas sp. isolate EM1]
MLRSGWVCRSMASHGGAADSWFGNHRSNTRWSGAVKSLILCIFGVACINLITRGNFMGYCENQAEIEIPLGSRRLPPPPSYGFVSSDESEK